MRLACLGVVFLVAGCAIFAETDSPAWQAGYSDGCATAQSALRAPATASSERQQPGYRAGYASGRALCGRADPSGTQPNR